MGAEGSVTIVDADEFDRRWTERFPDHPLDQVWWYRQPGRSIEATVKSLRVYVLYEDTGGTDFDDSFWLSRDRIPAAGDGENWEWRGPLRTILEACESKAETEVWT